MPGRYASATGASICAECEERTYSRKHGAVACTACVSPTTTRGVGAANCSACVSGYYWDPRITSEDRDSELLLVGPGSCSSCPTGTDCDNKSTAFYELETMPVSKGYYRFSTTATAVYECEGRNCRGGAFKVGEETCKANARGPLCALCDKDHFLSGKGSCKECSDSHIMESLTWIVAAVILLVALAVLWRFGKNISIPWLQDRRERFKAWILARKVSFEWAGVALRIMFYNCQIIAKYTELQDVDWPFPFDAYVSILNGLALDVTTLVPSLQCSPTWNGYTSLLIWTKML